MHNHPNNSVATPNYHVRFLLGTVINVLLVGIEIYYGIISNSVALISDALHNAGDSIGLFIAWGGYLMSRVKPTNRFTFGLKIQRLWQHLLMPC